MLMPWACVMPSADEVGGSRCFLCSVAAPLCLPEAARTACNRWDRLRGYVRDWQHLNTLHMLLARWRCYP